MTLKRSLVGLAALATLSVAVPFGLASARATKPDEAGEAKLAKILAGRVAGKPSDCIELRATEDQQTIDHTAIVYRDGGTLWVNRPVGGLDDLDWNSILVTKSYTSELCSVDPVHLVDRSSHFERGFLSLGKFVPYTKPR
jgi:hypothetical protein